MPRPLDVRSMRRSWTHTRWPSLVSRTSHSRASAPSSMARLYALRVCSGASSEDPRCATTLMDDRGRAGNAVTNSIVPRRPDPRARATHFVVLTRIVAMRRTDHLSRRESRRSASGLPPVWHVGQYCNEESAKATSRTVSPHTGHGCPVRPCTRSASFFSALRSVAASPRERRTASVSTSIKEVCSVSTSASDNEPPSRNGESFAAWSTSSL